MSYSRWLQEVREPPPWLRLVPVAPAAPIVSGERYEGRVEVSSVDGLHHIAPGEPELAFLFDQDQQLVGEFNEMVSGYGLSLTLAEGEKRLLGFVGTACLPGPVNAPPRPTPPGVYDLRVGLHLTDPLEDGASIGQKKPPFHMLSSAVPVTVVAPDNR